MTSPPQLDVHHLTRRFGDNVAVDDVSFSVRPGQMTGFVGANGAGKSSIINAVSGIVRPRAGTITFEGRNIAHTFPALAEEIEASRAEYDEAGEED